MSKTNSLRPLTQKCTVLSYFMFFKMLKICTKKVTEPQGFETSNPFFQQRFSFLLIQVRAAE